jgi:hypothetical protein
MLNIRLAAAKKVAASLFDAEAKIDQAMASTAGLVITTLEAGAEANLPACIGQAALDELCASVTALSNSRRAIVAAHERLSTARDQIGLRTVSFGDQFPKPEPTGLAEPERRIRAVS